MAADNPGVRMRLYNRDDSVNAVFDNRRDVGVLSEEFRTMRDARRASAKHGDDATDAKGSAGASRLASRAAGQPQIHACVAARTPSVRQTRHQHTRQRRMQHPRRTGPPRCAASPCTRGGTCRPVSAAARLQGGLAIEAALTAYEWNETRQRAQVFNGTSDNETTAVDATVPQGVKTVRKHKMFIY